MKNLDIFEEYRKGKTNTDKRLHSKASKKASKLMREYRKGKATRHTEILEG